MTEITLFDGSIGQELVRRTGDRSTPLWSTQVMLSQPQAVREVHADYFAAGATIATTNSYALIRGRLTRVEGLADRLADLVETAVTAARAARDAHGAGRVAGALGPLTASYRPDLCPPPERAADLYAETVRLLRPGIDLFLIETMSSTAEAEGALRATAGQGLPVWVSFTVMDEDGSRLRSGEPLADILPLLAAYRPDAVLVNCSPPEAIPAALPMIARLVLPFGAYANGFTRISEDFLKDAPTVDALERRRDLGPAAYVDMAMTWLDRGATILGGCCEVGPDHIAELARRL